MGSTVKIRRMIWDYRNIRHTARHNVDPDEVEEVVFGNPLPKHGQKGKTVVLIGETKAGRLLEVPLHNRGKGRYYPITAHDAGYEATVVYKRERGGEEAQ
jgi:uncharacterized protein